MTAPIDDLAKALSGHGIDLTGDALDHLLAGIAAAPVSAVDGDWVALFDTSEPLPQTLIEQLAAEIDRHRALLSTPPSAADRLAAVRGHLRTAGVDGFLVPRADAFQGEAVPADSERLAWLTGFTGSAGLAIVLPETALLFVDGRYTLQAADQVPAGLYETKHLVDTPPSRYLAENLPAGFKLGFDPWLHTLADEERLSRAVKKAGAELVPLDENPVDAVWAGRPPAPISPIRPQAIDHAGRSSADKRADIGAALAKAGQAAAILPAPDGIAWLLNLRGADVPNSPLPLAFAIAHGDGRVDLFTEPAKMTRAAREALGNQVAVSPFDGLGPALDGLSGKVRLDPATTPSWFAKRLSRDGVEIVRDDDPTALPKAKKNAAELKGMADAHIRDGAAMVRFLAWLDRAVPDGGVTELSAVEALYRFRAGDPLFRGTSFDTISGSGPNGAIVHYRVSPGSSRPLRPEELYLVDSGAQYLDGTTDITRTICFTDTPPQEIRRHFTLVLKGHIALATARFPERTTGTQLDILARLPLWRAGLDFDHGTGHGVGCYLNVHEGPQRISKAASSVFLEPGMVLSNEPGFYKAGGYGIRIENLEVVVASPPADGTEGEERSMLAFSSLTRCPMDRRLIDLSLLGAAERDWIDAYHREVAEVLAPLLDGDDKAWLEAATRPLGVRV